MPTDSFRIRPNITFLMFMILAWLLFLPAVSHAVDQPAEKSTVKPAEKQPEKPIEKQIVYIAAKGDLPYWKIIGQGVKSVADTNGYNYVEMDSGLNPQKQLKNAQDAIAKNVAGIIISPIDSKSVSDVLALALKAKIPVVIADVGAASGEYLSYVRSDHYRGAYDLGLAMAAAMKEKGWSDSPFSMITLTLTRKNGQDITNGFRDAMKDTGITKETPLHQMQDSSSGETQRWVKDLLVSTPTLRGLFIESDQAAAGAIQAVKDIKKTGALFLASFDITPDVADLLKSDALLAAGMQQPFLIGTKSAGALFSSLSGTAPPKQILVPVLIANGKNITQLISVANKTVFGKDGP